MLETERLILRPFIPSDAKALFEFGSNEMVQRYTGDKSLSTIAEAHHIIQNVLIKDYQEFGYGRWAAVYKPEQRVIGFAGLKYLPDLNLTDIGFRFLPDYWNRGLATECSLALIDYGFQQLKLEQIIAIAMPENLASNKVLQKIGMKHYKNDEYEGDGQSYNWYRIFAKDLEKKSQPNG